MSRFDQSVSNIQVDKNILARGTLVARNIYSSTLHSPQMETQELFVKGTAVLDNLIIHDEQQHPTGGIRTDGDFLLTTTTQSSEWVSPLNLSSIIVHGNRIGQICSLYLELTSSSGVADGSVLFSHLPDSFQPQVRVVTAVSLWDGVTFSPATLVFDSSSKQVYFYGTWNAGYTLMATLHYFRLS
jgi:hypothetical protein